MGVPIKGLHDGGNCEHVAFGIEELWALVRGRERGYVSHVRGRGVRSACKLVF